MEYIILLLNNVFAFFDRIIGWAIAEVYDLIITVSSSTILDAQVVQQFSDRISVLLSIFMLFWLAFRMIKYAINPDMTSDSSQGFGKIIVNVVVMLAMLVLVDYGFTYAAKFQNEVVKSQVLVKAVFGVSDSSANPIDDGSDVGNEMSYYLYSAFISPSSMLTKCKNFYGLEGTELDDCVNQIEKRSSFSVRNDWVEGNNTKDVQSLLSSNVVSARDGSDYLFSYLPVVSTVCGLVMLVLIISIAVDIAVRVVKLAFLQIIAPIPIISYIDPNSGKNGIFKAWFKMVCSTYVSLFVKLITIYFTVFFISYAAKGEIILSTGKKATIQNEPFVVVLIIIGTLMFAKNLPKLLSEIFGINLDGGTFSSIAKGFKKAGNFAGGVALGAGAAVGAGALGAIGGGASNSWAAFRNRQQMKNDFSTFDANGKRTSFDKAGYKAELKKNHQGLQDFGSIVGGVGSAGGRAAYHSATTKDGMLKSASSGISDSNTARNARDAFGAADQNYNAGNRFVDSIDEAAGFQNKYGGYGSMDETIHAQEKAIKRLNAEEEAYRDYASQISGRNGNYSLTEYDKMYDDYKKFKADHPNTTGEVYAKYKDEQKSHTHGSDYKDMGNYLEARYAADLKHNEADVEKGKLDKNKQAYAARTDKGHGGHK